MALKRENSSFQQIFATVIQALSAKRQHLRWIAISIALPIAVGIFAYNLALTQSPVLQAQSTTKSTPAEFNERTSIEIAQTHGEVIEFVVNRNDTLDRIFRQARLDLADLAAIRNLSRMREDLDALKPGELITLTHIDGALQKLTRRLSETELLAIAREPAGFTANVIETPLEIRAATARGVIDSSLFVAARSAGVSSEVIMQLANDVFGWDIDFALEIQPRDRFGVIYEQKFRDGEYRGDGQILAAEFVNAGHVYNAVHFQSANGVVSDYFTPDGKSMRKQFLRAPVDFKYISSNFNPHRLHPILNLIRAHQGVDYSAPTGTPVRASGDGRVAHVGEQGGYGNSIILEHSGGISTLYGHLSRFAKGLHVGDHVTQGELIGYVGSTGSSTAPHLHYEYRLNGVHKNPRTVALPDAQLLPKEYAEEFQAKSRELLAKLHGAQPEFSPTIATR